MRPTEAERVNYQEDQGRLLEGGDVCAQTGIKGGKKPCDTGGVCPRQRGQRVQWEGVLGQGGGKGLRGAEITEVKRGGGRDKKDCWVGAQGPARVGGEGRGLLASKNDTEGERNRRLSRRAAVEALGQRVAGGRARPPLEVIQGRGAPERALKATDGQV